MYIDICKFQQYRYNWLRYMTNAANDSPDILKRVLVLDKTKMSRVAASIHHTPICAQICPVCQRITSTKKLLMHAHFDLPLSLGL